VCSLVERFVSSDGFDVQVLRKSDKQGVVHGTVKFDCNIECSAEKPSSGLHLDWETVQFG